MEFQPGFSTSTLQDTTLLIPSVSIANIPQLALDLLLHSLDFEKVATLSDEYLYPFISPVDHADKAPTPRGVSFGLEVFFCKDKRITLVQQRTPLMPGFAERHVSEVIVPFVEASQFKNIVTMHLLDAGLAQGGFPGDVVVFTPEDVLTESLGSLEISKASTQPSIVASRDLSPYAVSVFGSGIGILKLLSSNNDCAEVFLSKLPMSLETKPKFFINLSSRLSLFAKSVSSINKSNSSFGAF
ncbi:hypothetical protein HF325_003652 [Metschnikowia pulcherrima]|uniref:Proteasome assembly chaperone 2 n=1 Tax=Metschnikowia pulcherrima TaxID=27326 RepID=A0A8H7GTF9_9ASCO|nr:hypothetical protein HF325_003652 [Metschnikowia pulcherrima]